MGKGYVRRNDVLRAFPHGTYWQIVTDHVEHATVESGVVSVGWKNLMPWERSSVDALVRYVEMFTRTTAPGNEYEKLAWARAWDRQQRQKPFYTWFDQQVPVHQLVARARSYTWDHTHRRTDPQTHAHKRSRQVQVVSEEEDWPEPELTLRGYEFGDRRECTHTRTHARESGVLVSPSR